MKKGLLIIVMIWFLFCNNLLFAITQNIRGKVVDAVTEIPLPFSSIIVMNSNPLLGVSSDAEGKFLIENLIVGSYDLEITYVGYETSIVKNVVLNAGKEVVLKIKLKEKVQTLSEIIIKSKAEKEKPINQMAIISARKLSVEEASRYAGGFDDPARLAGSFAGVASRLGDNGIVVRGNAPKGLLWRLEGVEIPNPNHFAEVTAFGAGGLTALSSQMLANSDFLTGAYPAEYGNALSGVFDIFMRTGNNRKNEHTFRIGSIGIDISSEGPFKKGSNSSYLFNYRYSTLSLLSFLLPEGAGGINYQDLSFKFNFPTKKAGVFTLWGIGVLDNNSGSKVEENIEDWIYERDLQDGNNKQKMGAIGLSHKLFLGKKSMLKTTIALTGNSILEDVKQLNQNEQLSPLLKIADNSWTFSLSGTLKHKFNPKHSNKTGFVIKKMNYDILLKEAPAVGEDLITFTDEKGESELFQGFTQSSLSLSNRLILNLGVHFQYFILNNNYSIEPRFSIQYQTSSNSSISFGYGLHSRLEKLGFYLTKTNAGANPIQANKSLEFSNAHHFVLGFDFNLSENTRLKIEPYYQYLINIPVDPNSSFSFINLEEDWFINTRLNNDGVGRNYGVDLTIERFLHKGWYYLLSASVFDSKYKAGDNIWRNTRYNKNVVVNVLFGKEWKVGRLKQNTFGINSRVTYQGGDRLTPYNEPLSLLAKDIVDDDVNAFSEQKPDVFLLHFTLNYRKNKRKHSSVWSLQVLNALGNKEFYGYRYNYLNATIDEHKESIIVPNISYKIEF